MHAGYHGRAHVDATAMRLGRAAGADGRTACHRIGQVRIHDRRLRGGDERRRARSPAPRDRDRRCP